LTVDDVAAIQAAAMDAEDRRREVASQTPGLGTLLELPQPPNAAAVGKAGVPGLDVVGEGYATTPEVSAAAVKAYGPARPVYADGVVGGVDFVAGRQEAPVKMAAGFRRSDDGVVVVSPSSRPGLLARLTGRFRRH
jgi:hypothetical protein